MIRIWAIAVASLTLVLVERTTRLEWEGVTITG